MTRCDPPHASRRAFLGAAASAGVAALFVPRLWATEPHPVRSPLNTLSDQDEIALSDLLASDLEKELELIDNVLVTAYLANLTQKLAAVSQRPELPYTCKLVNSHEINAFSILGGRVYLHRGLVETIASEDELVAALSHEIGHVVARHSANQMMLTFQARRAYNLVRSNIPDHAQQILDVIAQLGGAVTLIGMLHFSRANEFEADMLGFYETLRAGYQPAGFITLFNRLLALEKQSAGLPPAFLRDHPPADERAEAIRQELTTVRVPSDAETDSFSFQAFRMGVKLLPQPVKKEATNR